MAEAVELLKKYWKHDNFRVPQEAIITSVLEGNDSFALLPTGGGKSVCYQIPALMMEGICLVISPLIALMKDQVQNLKSKDIKATTLLGGISQDEVITILDNCKFGGYKFLYLSPERLQQEWIIDRLKQLPINLIAIDEAHCVSQWGHDFRPAYLKISNLKNHFPKTPFLALTATANKRVRADIIENLALNNPKFFTKSFTRPNLAYHVIKAADKLYKIQQILTKNKQSSIIYVRNRRSCLDFSQKLNALGFLSTFYHGGMTPKDKENNMQLWLENKVQVIVATNAFGMGIDKPDVKTVIHVQIPENIENYYQEAGRAGRNGEKAFGILLANETDIATSKNQLLNTIFDKKFLQNIYLKLNNYFQIAYGEGFNETFNFNLNHFSLRYEFPVAKTFAALQFLDRQGIISFQNENSDKIVMQFVISSKEMLRYISLHPNDEPIITAILRTYTGIFEIEISVNPNLIAKKANKTIEEVKSVITQLSVNQCIILQMQNNDSAITFLEIREDNYTLNRVIPFLDHQNQLKMEQYKSMISYIQNEDLCKNNLLLRYFDEELAADCGVCSTCIQKNKSATTLNPQLILDVLEKEPLTSRELENKLACSAETLIFTLQLLLEHRKLGINNSNKYYIL